MRLIFKFFSDTSDNDETSLYVVLRIVLQIIYRTSPK